MNNDQVIIDRKKLEQLEKLNSDECLFLKREMKDLQEKIKIISEGKTAVIVFENWNTFGIQQEVKFFESGNISEILEVKMIYSENSVLKNENEKLKSRTLFDYIFKRKSS